MKRLSVAMIAVCGVALAGCSGGSVTTSAPSTPACTTQAQVPSQTRKAAYHYAQLTYTKLVTRSFRIGLQLPSQPAEQGPTQFWGWDEISKKLGCRAGEIGRFDLVNYLGSKGWKLVSVTASPGDDGPELSFWFELPG